MKRFTAFLLLLASLAPLVGAAPPDAPVSAEIALPVVAPPAPPSPPPLPPSAAVPLPADVLFVVTSARPFIVVASPQGLVSISHEAGPLRVRGRFVEAPGKTVTRNLTAKHIAVVEAIGTGKVELLVWPTGATDTRQVLRQWVEASVGPAPPPVPPVPPVPPPGPSPIPAPGFRVLIVYESAETYPIGLSSVIYGKAVRDYLKAKCAVDADNPQGAFRIWDKDIATAGAGKLWEDAMKRPRTSVPWLLISTGSGGFEGPLPASVDEALTLLRKHGG